jgi:RHS repeat-associated protein
MGPLLLEDPAKGSFYYHADALGSVLALTDGTGTPVAGNRWEPYGLPRPGSQTAGAPVNPLGWAGQYQDPDGSVHLRARQYDTATGRFTATDPASAVAYSSTYTYASANPLVLTDPYGLWDWRGTVGNVVDAASWVAVGAGMVAVAVAAGATGIGAPVAAVAGGIAVAAGAITAAGSAVLAADTCTNGKGSCGEVILSAAVATASTVFIGRAAAAVGRSAAKAAPEIKSGIYVVNSADGVYVGQSSDISRRLAQHVNSGKFTSDEVANAARQGVAGGKLQREIAEQTMIDQMGGIDNLLNVVDPIGPRRFGMMPNQPYGR